MNNLNPLKIGKYTFWVSFIIGNIFMFGAISPFLRDYWNDFAIGGFYYLFIASAINILILIFLSAYCYYIKEKAENYLKAIGYILLNIPVAAIYAYIGLNYII